MTDLPNKITPIHFVPKFCSQCGSPLVEKFLIEEKRTRLCCSQCSHIAYLNPQVVAGAIPNKDGKILLLKRGIEPAKSTWTYPAGFAELDETVEEAAVRETEEEIGVKIAVGKILGIYSYPNGGVVTVVYLAEVVSGEMQTSPEAEDVREFTAQTIPWDNLSFKSSREALEDWVKLGKSR